MTASKDDLLDRARAHLVQCPACDAGMSDNCVCPPSDPRSVIDDLVGEVLEQRARIAELELALDQERGVA